MAERGCSSSNHDLEEGLHNLNDSVTFENVKAFMLYHDGKVKHSDLVNFFRRPLTDPNMKGRNRSDFKDILMKNMVFKNENGEKYVIFNRSHACRLDATPRKLNRPNPKKDFQTNGQNVQNSILLSEDMQHERIERNILLGSCSTLSSQSSSSTFDSAICMDSQSAMSSIAGRIRDLSNSNDSLDDELMAELNYEEGCEDTNGYNEFSEEEKQWMMYASLCDCQQLASMMDKNPELPRKRDFITTALHWGAKLGKRDLVRLIADAEVDVNARTGQTSLHLAAIHGHDIVIKMLINDYGADVHARDYAGKKPKDLVKDTVAPDLQRKLGRSLILDPNLHVISGVIRRNKDEAWMTRFDSIDRNDGVDQNYTPETRRRLRTMSFLRKKKRWPEKGESDEEVEKSTKDKHKIRPKSSIHLLTPETARKLKDSEQAKSLTSFEF